MPDMDRALAAIASNVRHRRTLAGLSIDELALAAGISRGTVIATEHKSGNPSVATLLSLAEALETTIAALLVLPEQLEISRTKVIGIHGHAIRGIEFEGYRPAGGRLWIYYSALAPGEAVAAPARWANLTAIIFAATGTGVVTSPSQELNVDESAAVSKNSGVEITLSNKSSNECIFVVCAYHHSYERGSASPI